MPPPTTAPLAEWDSFGPLIGVSTRPTDSRIVTPGSVNMDFRYGNAPRNGYYGMHVVYDDEKNDKEIFEKGNVQKFSSYHPYGNHPAALVYLIAGRIFVAYISSQTLFVKRLWPVDAKGTALRADLQLGWMCQGFEWLVIQNGSDRPVIWNGSNELFQSDPDKAQMPIGGPMAFIHHSIAVCSTDGNDKIAVSDRWRQTASSNVWKFEDTPTWDNAGVFGLHANFGKVMVLAVVPQVKQTPNGQGDLLIGGTNGAQTLNLQVPIDQRLDSQIQDTALVGSGFASYLGVLPVKSSIYFVGQRGLQEVRRSQADFSQSDSDTSESGDVDYYWNMSNPGLRALTPLGHHDDRIFMGCMPETSPSSYGADHRYSKAWLTLDVAERYRQGQRIPRAWYGLQCGPRPVEWVSDLIVNRTHRSYVVSHDADGINRTYEVSNFRTHDVVDGNPKKVKWFFMSPKLGAQKGDALLVKKPQLARVDFKRGEEKATLSLEWHGEASNCWKAWGERVVMADADVNKLEVADRYNGTIPFSTPLEERSCEIPSQTQLVLKISGEGRLSVDNVFVRMDRGDTPEADLRKLFLDYQKKGQPIKFCPDELDLYALPNG